MCVLLSDPPLEFSCVAMACDFLEVCLGDLADAVFLAPKGIVFGDSF